MIHEEHERHLQRITVPWRGQELELAYRLRQGHASPGCLVLLHGLGCSQRSFAGIWTHDDFAASSVLSLDFPGFGDSDKPEGFSYRLEDQAELVLELLRMMGVPAVHLLGHSMGGAVAVLLAKRLADPTVSQAPRLDGLALVEGTLIAEDCGVSKVAAGMTQRHFEQQFFPDYKTRTPPLHRAFLALELAGSHSFYKSADSLWSWARSGKLLQSFLELRRPRLYLFGRSNKNLPVLERLEVAADIERSAVPDSGHFPMNENPGRFYEMLAQWVAETTPQSRG